MKESAAAVFFWVFVGGALGSIAREVLTPLLTWEPAWAVIMLVNVAAAFLAGWLYGSSDRLHHHLVSFAAVGFCGGFSTFSTFADQVLGLVAAGDLPQASADIAGTLILGIAAAYLGDLLGGKSFKDR